MDSEEFGEQNDFFSRIKSEIDIKHLTINKDTKVSVQTGHFKNLLKSTQTVYLRQTYIIIES